MLPFADPGVPRRVAGLPWTGPERWRVGATRRETRDVVTLELEPPRGSFSFLPGEFDMLEAIGVGEVPISISGDPAIASLVVHTIRDVGAVTHALCELRPGDEVGVRGPFGTHWPLDDAEGRDVLVIAGGVGLPPVRPAIHHLLGQRDRYGRVAVLYGARTPDDLLFGTQLADWRGRFDLQLEVTVDSAQGGWKGTVGVVPDLIPRAQVDPARAVAFVVGPEIMMRFAVKGLLAAGFREDAVFLSLERNMQCAVGLCGHCQLGPFFVCRDGPVFGYDRIGPWFRTREL
jgi:NAD(P)H-flavin reductase